MKTIVIDQATDLQTLAQRLGGTAARTQGLAENLKRLNPHLNFDKLAAGTVLLVADDANAGAAATQALGGAQFAALAAQLKTGVDATLSRSLQTLAAQTADRKAVADAIKTPAMKRAIDSDVDLKARAGTVADELKKEQASAKDTEQTLKLLHGAALAEIAAALKALS
jgi:hypothetical protein